MATQKPDLVELSNIDVSIPIAPEQYSPVLALPPFIFVDGTFNTRDLGLVPDSPLRPNFAFRSGALAGLTDDGKAALTGKLGVKRVFDLRSPEECAHMPDPIIDGVEKTWIQSRRPDSEIDLANFVTGEGEAGYEDMYLEVVDIYAESWKAIIEHVRDRPEDPFLVHCTAGRDRTGIFGAMLLALAGASEDVIFMDWQLSRIGTEPLRTLLIEFARKGSNASTTSSSASEAAFHNLINLRRSCWQAFMRAMENQHGGFERFVAEKLGFSQDDMAKVKRNLVAAY